MKKTAAQRQATYRLKRQAAESPDECALRRARAVERVREWENAHPDRPKRIRDPVKAAARRARWRAKNPGYVPLSELANRATKKEATKLKRAAQRVESYKRRLSRNKEWGAANPDRVTAYQAAWYATNRTKLLERQRAWNKAHPGYLKQKRATNVEFAITSRLRARLRKALKAQGATRAANTLALLGCTGADFRAYIEAQFSPGMTWSNRAEWHLDHKVPCSYFDLTDPKQQTVCFHFSNIQPLWKKANRTKGAKVLAEFLTRIIALASAGGPVRAEYF